MNHPPSSLISVDNFPLWLALLGAVVSLFAYLLRASRLARVAYAAAFAALAYASVYLMQAILSGQRFDIAYVAGNTSVRDATLFRISSFWAGQQGSLMLWAIMVGAIGFVFGRDRGSARAAAFWCALLSFLLLLLVVDDPFAPQPSFQPGMDGAGLNPLLKNPWMAAHPPVIFLGYALLMVPAAIAVGAFVGGDRRRWAATALPWTLAGWVVLGAGIVMGMVWSYEVLGWGGYWGWDAVENASLIPWILGAALVHGLVLQRNRGLMARANVATALAVFLSVLYASYLTRSGASEAVSVHSFVASASASYLMWGVIVFAVLCVAALTKALLAPVSSAVDNEGKMVDADSPPAPIRLASRDSAMVAGTIALLLFAGVVLVGTSYSIFGRGRVGGPFYNTMSLVLGLVFLVLIGLSTLAPWSTRKEPQSAARSVLVAALGYFVALILVAAVVLIARLGSELILRIALPVFALITLAIACAKGVRASWRRSGVYVAHAGVALFAMGVVFSCAGGSEKLDLVRGGDSRSAFGREFSFLGRRTIGPGKVAADFVISGLKARIVTQFSDRGSATAPFVISTLREDLYVAPNSFPVPVVTPMVALVGDGLRSVPAAIPESRSTLTLIGMQVESQQATLDYTAPGRKPVRFTVAADRPADLDGYTFSFIDFHNDSRSKAHTVGVQVAVAGRGLRELAIIEVSTKPLIYLVWIGGILIILGGALSAFRRRAGNAKPDNGLLSDSPGPD